MPALIAHPTGHYRFLPGIAPYSCGVIAEPGFEIVRVTLRTALAWQAGFGFVRRVLAEQGCQPMALCAMELRSPRPFTMQGFIEFNRRYCSVLEDWGVFVDGANPIARTNVCPLGLETDEPLLHAFSFVRSNAKLKRPTFIVAGAGELVTGELQSERILRSGETSPDAIAEKARYVCDVMCERLQGLGGQWDGVTVIDAYTIHPLHALMNDLLLARLPAARRHGIHWNFTRPPVVDIEFEMDLRGIVTEWQL